MNLPTHSTQHVKKINTELVKQTLRTNTTGTKASIARLTGLSVATCGTILNELVHSGEIIDLGTDESSGGRPANRYRFNADYASMICMIVRTEGGVHTITCAVANLNGELAEHEIHTLEQIDVPIIEQLLDDLTQTYTHVRAIGIGIPGVALGDTIGICDVPQLANQPLASLLKQRYEGVEILLENDMNLTVYGLYQQLQLEQDRNFAIVTFPRNHYPGAGFIVNGQPMNGNSYFSGEISYLPYGVSREQQLELLQSAEQAAGFIVQSLVSIIAIINPVQIIITGDSITADMLSKLDAGCRAIIPAEHMPTLLIQNDTRSEYLSGLITATMERLTYHIQLIQRR